VGTPLRFAVIGAGFWARYQLAGWREAAEMSRGTATDGAECIAICNRTRSRAEELAKEFGIPAVYTEPAEMLRAEKPDVVDIISAPDLHEEHVNLAASCGVPVICQKPMAPTLAAAERMVAVCRDRQVPFFVHENWRWQAPIRALKRALSSGDIGTPFRGWISLVTGYPVFTNQPFLREEDRFILADLGVHLLDVARFLFGEATSLLCQADRVHADIKGEDVATVMLRTAAGATVVVAMGYAENHLENDRFPETRIFVEGTRGSVELAGDYWVRVTIEKGTRADRVPPPFYPWVNPIYTVVQTSIVPCIADIMRGLRQEGAAETTGEDNLKTVKLVAAAYESAGTGQAVRIT
jgi:predicted dehydrogenase